MKMRISRRLMGAALALGLVTASAAACGDGDDEGKGGSTPSKGALNGVTIEVAAVWTGAEQANFKKVLDAFSKQTGAKINLTPTGDNVSTYLGSKVEGGTPPDVAMMPQQGVLTQFAQKGWLKPLGPETQDALKKNYAQIWQELGSYNGTMYGVYFKAANKSTVWYRTQALSDAGVQPPATWADLVKISGTIADSGTIPWAIAGGDGWTLTDWFENVYASQAGLDNYDKLSKHQIKWTDKTVKDALRTLAQIWGKSNYIVGGNNGALQTDMPTSVTQVFGDNAKGAMVYEGDFVPGVITEQTKAKVGTDAKFFPFPAVGQEPPVVGGGDAAVAMKDSKGAQELLRYLATPEAAKVWAQAGGFTSPNKALDLSVYPDEIQRQIAKSVIEAGNNFRFDMSDLAPAAFGGTKGAGEWKDLQDFLKNPSNVDGTAAKLEADAEKAYK